MIAQNAANRMPPTQHLIVDVVMRHSDHLHVFVTSQKIIIHKGRLSFILLFQMYARLQDPFALFHVRCPDGFIQKNADTCIS